MLFAASVQELLQIDETISDSSHEQSMISMDTIRNNFSTDFDCKHDLCLHQMFDATLHVASELQQVLKARIEISLIYLSLLKHDGIVFCSRKALLQTLVVML